MITIVCYDRKETWSGRYKAIKFYKTGMNCCDPYSSEWERYSTIVAQLMCGFDFCCDEDVTSEEKAKGICEKCTELNPRTEAERMASL